MTSSTNLFNRTSAVVISALTAGALIATATGAHATEVSHPSATASAPVSADGPEVQKLIDTLAVIDEMPDSVVEQGDSAVQAYLGKHLPGADGVQARAALGWWDTAKCAAAIALAVGSAAIPVAKILKLKKFIDKVGSVKKAAYLLIRVAKGEEKIEELGAVLGGLAGTIIGIDSIKEDCG